MDAAASIIAFIQAAGAIVKLSVQAKQLWDQIQGAPSHIAHLLEDLQLYQDMFEEMECTFAANRSISELWAASSVFSQAVERARHARVNLERVVSDIHQKLSTSRRFKKKLVSFHTLFRKDEIQRLDDKLSRTLSLLKTCTILLSPQITAGLVITACMNHSASLLPQTTIDASEATQSTSDCVSLRPRPRPRSPLPTQSFALSKHISERRAKRIRLSLPNWIVQSTVELLYSSHLSGYNFRFRVFNTISYDAEILTVIQNGDINRLKDMFRSKEASLYDKDRSGMSLLHYATEHQQYEICSLLLQEGLDDQIDDRYGCIERYNPLNVLTIKSRERWDPGSDWHRISELFKSYLSRSCFTSPEKLFDFVPDWVYDDSFLHLFLDNFAPNYFSVDPKVRFEAARLGSFVVNGAYTLKGLVTLDETVAALDVANSCLEGFSLLHSAAIGLGIRYPDDVLPFQRGICYRQVYGEDWSWWVSEVARHSTKNELHVFEEVIPWHYLGVPEWQGTPLLSVIGGALCFLSFGDSIANWDKAFQETLALWLRSLQEADVDLEAYGEREVEIIRARPDECRGAFDFDAYHRRRQNRPWMHVGVRLPRSDLLRKSWKWDPDAYMSIRIIGFRVGKKPEDWRLLWAPEYEVFAMQFWELLEEPDLQIPGCYPDE